MFERFTSPSLFIRLQASVGLFSHIQLVQLDGLLTYHAHPEPSLECE